MLIACVVNVLHFRDFMSESSYYILCAPLFESTVVQSVVV